MSLSSNNTQLTEVENHGGRRNDSCDNECNESCLRNEEDEGVGEEEDEEDEDEDVDFNPFLKEALSPEASSSLSSEIDGLDGDVVDSGGKTFDNSVGVNLSEPSSAVQNSAVGDFEHGEEESVMQASVSPEGACEKELKNSVYRNPKKRKSCSNSQPKTDTVQTKDNGSESDYIDVLVGELSNSTQSQMPIVDLENEDAICKRTRARYSLASFTLDELETFLQETDDDDDLPNVDDEKEYRKFLAAVLNGGDGDGQSNQENENVDDEDEDNDADFEIELQELLESDVDESPRDKTRKEFGGAGRRPETRQNRCQKNSAQYKKKLSGQAKRPLRPLLPVLPNGPTAVFPTNCGKTLMPHSWTAEDGSINGFTLHQIGQLHCLIHEHVQLLIQVFSLSVLDPTRQQIASQVRGLIFEMLQKRNEVLAWRSVPYPSICFNPPYVCSSVPDEHPKAAPARSTLESCPPFNAQSVCYSVNNQMLASQNMSPSKGRCVRVFNEQVGSFQNIEDSLMSKWVPSTNDLVLSILDVAPLNLVGRYMDDVYTAVQDYRHCPVKSSSDTPFEREPLFPLPSFPLYAEANSEVLRGPITSAVNMVSSAPSQQPPKKTMAAALVESTKKQSVALVPKEIVKLAQRFFPLFNPSLFPHKPPPAAVVSRVLFTDAEDELLALGLMEYNTDWKAIQQRFLPCKSKHQIFVRQKNRCSSKAPENPIKAVRKMKTSPLTMEEITCIQEGLKAYKLDWMSVWRFVVPHRDPSLLPRQWRVAFGTQRSYKQDAEKKERRRLYESRRRKNKTADLASWQTASEKEDDQAENAGGDNKSGDESTDNAGEGYVHQAFLADWRPDGFSLNSSALPCSNVKDNPGNTLSQEGTHMREQQIYDGSREAQLQTGIMHKFSPSSQCTQLPYISSQFASARNGTSNIMEPNHPAMTSNNRKSQFWFRPYRARKKSGASNSHLVKLAPDLPPVNLPPSVRVVSQTDFKVFQFGASTKKSVPGGIGNSGIENLVSGNPHAMNLGTTHLVKTVQKKNSPLKDNVRYSHIEESEVAKNKCIPVERQIDSDLQMHPLLFQSPEDGHLPYYPLNCSTSTSSSFSFFSGNQPQLNLNLFHNPHPENYVEGFTKSLKSKESTVSSGIDFHPLLQRTDQVYTDSASTEKAFDAIQTESLVSCGLATSANPPSPMEKANELDLEIHLSYTSRNKKGMENRDVTACNPTLSVVAASHSGSTTKSQNINGPHYEQGDICPTVSAKLVSGGHGLAIPSNNISRYPMDDIGDQSHPEIVMEQEELSDSDEEIEEHVEFECEEMADSEGEDGSGCEQIAEIHNKEGQNIALENLATGAASNDTQCEPRAHCHPQGDVHILGKDITPSLELGLSNQGMDDSSNFSWLSLDSCAPDRLLSTKPSHEESITAEGPVSKNISSLRPNRSCKKKKTSNTDVTVQKHAVVMAKQLSLGPLATPTMKKPRKRACRSNTSLNIGLTFESSSGDGKDRLG